MDLSSLSWVFTALGHLSFALTFASYAQSNIIKLRIIAVIGLTCGLLYNGYVNYQMPPGQDIRLVLFWLALFWLQNVYLLWREIGNAIEVPLSSNSRLLGICTFTGMSSRDWKLLEDSAEKRKYLPGDVLLAKDSSTSAVYLVASGFVKEESKEGIVLQQTGMLWGDFTYCVGESYLNASPVSIIAHTDVEIYSWSYDKLRDLMQKSPTLQVSLLKGFVQNAGFKRGFGRRE